MKWPFVSLVCKILADRWEALVNPGSQPVVLEHALAWLLHPVAAGGSNLQAVFGSQASLYPSAEILDFNYCSA